MKLFNVSETQKQIIAFVILAFTLIALSLHISAVIVSDDAVTTDEYAYCMYDYETKEFSTHYAPKTNATETWQFFTEREVAQMRIMSSNPESVLPSSFVETVPTTGTPASAMVNIRAHYDTDGDGVADVVDETGGTGFLVSENVVVTAAHCVVPSTDEGMIRNYGTLVELRIYYGQHGGTELNAPYVTASRQYWSYGYTAEDFDVRARYDYCVIDLAEPISRSYYFNCVPASNVAVRDRLYLFGYNGYSIVRSSGTVSEIWDDLYYNIGYTNSSIAGMSGGAVCDYPSGNCVAVHSGIYGYGNSSTTYSYGVLFHTQFFNLVCERIERTS